MSIGQIIGGLMLAPPFVLLLVCAAKTEEGRAALILFGLGTFVMLWVMVAVACFYGGWTEAFPHGKFQKDSALEDDMEQRSCWYYDRGAWRGGKLLSWGVDSFENHDNVLTCTCGVVEDDGDGCCHSVAVSDICFHATPPER